MTCVVASGLVHVVTCEHFETSDGYASMKLDLACGGRTFVERDFEWWHDGVPTCFQCISRESRNYVRDVEYSVSSWATPKW